MSAPRPREWNFRSTITGAAWPALPGPGGAAALALLLQLERSEWLDAAALRALQLRQLEALLAHAHASVPWYREHWAGRYDPARQLSAGRFAELPLLPRRALQQQFEALNSSAVPARSRPALGIAHFGRDRQPGAHAPRPLSPGCCGTRSLCAITAGTRATCAASWP